VGLASAGRDSLLRKCVAFIDRVPSADNKPDGRNPEHQAKYRKKQPTCLLNAVVHCSLLSRGRHRNGACRNSVPENSPIGAFATAAPDQSTACASPWSASGQTEVLPWVDEGTVEG
jgi:hypothetical protein